MNFPFVPLLLTALPFTPTAVSAVQRGGLPPAIATRLAATRKPTARVVSRIDDRPLLSPTADGLASIDAPAGKLGDAWLGVYGKVEFIDRAKGLIRVQNVVVKITKLTEFNGFAGRAARLDGVKVADLVTVGGAGGGENLTADEIRLEDER